MLIAGFFPPSRLELIVFPGVFFVVVFRWAMHKLRDTTLVAPCWWSVAALLVLYCSYGERHDFGYWSYTAGVFLLAPTLALLGAKRPQSTAWQFIVVTLVGVLMMPVFQGQILGDKQPHVHMLFRWLIVTHIVVGVVNYLPTRYVGPAFLLGAAQTVLTARYLPFTVPTFGEPVLWAMQLIFIAVVWLRWGTRRASRISVGPTRLWIDFRDAYGLVWGLRIAERLNVAAGKHGWPIEFTWSGMLVKTDSGGLDPELRHRIERELRSHLRRFVSHEWIVRRLHDEPRA